MHYRKMGDLPEKVSALGFGAMRFPLIDDDYGKIAEEKTIKMLDYALEKGVNYIDTAWSYHEGESENFLGRYLQERGDRDELYLATKLPTWLIEEKKDLDYYLEQQLKKLQTDYFDFYLLHTLNRERWETMVELNIMDWLLEKKAEGKINYLGFSFHDEFDLFKEIIDHSSSWDFCQIQYNYMDQEYQAGKKGLKYAAQQGLGVIIMEPLRGGLLAQEPPEEVKALWRRSNRDVSPAARALEWLWDQPEVSLVLSGMSKLDEVKENIATAAGLSGPNELNSEEKKLVDQAAEKYNELAPIDCTGCNYCTPCPEEVFIPRVFDYYNQAHIYNNYEEIKESYDKLIEKEKSASSCISCLQCEDKCPQDLPIAELMNKIEEYFK